MILAIESATPHGSVALVAGERVLAETVLPPGRPVSETFLAAVDGLLVGRDRGPDAVTHVAVSAGPGSFTGLRVGMAAAKGFCFGWRIPLVPVPTLQALASRFRIEEAAICPILDARKKEVYAGLFRWTGDECLRLAPERTVLPDLLPEWIPAGKVFFCGDGTVPYGDRLKERLGERALFPPPGEGLPRASSVGLLAGRMILQGGAAEPRSVVPAYLRPSEAEIRRKGLSEIDN